MLDIDIVKEQRLAICKSCPLYKEGPYGATCNSSKYISPDGKDGSWMKKAGYKKGCGCSLRHRSSNPNAHCIINKG